ncbi:bifunctional protein-serine/threonine kinase/phosphatase [Agaribacter marinus]|uniref:Protein kinase n=1 Tax=Agaribacter marinus TaxID=1431249 RepID=A0AA37WKW3_9ALTE|nr:bifunctional protein-serine/threonine kinase/phosphatase [Agaribacter marinus]GLR71375.1 protein kinase [Agaribacter marinus]
MTQSSRSPTSSLSLQFGGKSIAGAKSMNQDAFAAHLPDNSDKDFKGGAAAIADGVSSCKDSHIASQASVTSFIQDYFSTPQSWSVPNAVSRVLTALNNWLHKENSQSSREQDSKLCTFSAVVIKSNTLHVFHVGDSRVYLLQDGELELLTTDHVRMAGGTQFLARAMGADRHLDVDYASRIVNKGDQILMTTDGVHEHISQNALRDMMLQVNMPDPTRTNIVNLGDNKPFGVNTPEMIADKMVKTALDRGSDDNLTALIVSIDELPSETLDETHKRVLQLAIPPVLAQGNKLDDYEVLDVIFSGTRSHMYLVKDKNTSEKFVLKAPSLNFQQDTLYLDGFIREEWVGQKIDHPNVMKTYKPRPDTQFLYYLGEHIQGMNLREWMNDNPNPPLDEVRDLTKQIIAGLRAFQRADMVHQDLKPENIMINQDGRVKILDFGTVKIAGVEEMNSPLDKSIPQGSVNYVAPEYLRGEQGNFQADLFSLGVIVYEMITGQLPYKEMSTNDVSLARYSDLEYRPAIHHRKDLPFWVEGCLKKALQPNPRYRYMAFSEFLLDLTKPNQTLEANIQHQPLIEKNPILVWQIIAAALLGLNLLQLLIT